MEFYSQLYVNAAYAHEGTWKSLKHSGVARAVVVRARAEVARAAARAAGCSHGS